MPTILLIEDDAEIRGIEKDYLVKEGYRILEARDGRQAHAVFGSEAVDLVVLDLNLPGLDGVQVCKAIRSSSGVPIIMLTARTKEIDELLGLEVGADDYIKKPFSPRILVARVKALLKRPELVAGGQELDIADLHFDIAKMTLTRGETRIDLTSIQFNILLTLAQHQGRIFSRDELLERGYDTALAPDIFDRTIDAHIKNIRKQIEVDTQKPRYIVTIRGRGYAFGASVT